MTIETSTNCLYAYRLFSVLLPIGAMFIANSHAVIYSGLLFQIGLSLNAWILLYSPWVLLPCWVISLHIWSPIKKTCLKLAGRFILFTAIFIGLFGAIDKFAFRNTKTLQIDRWPETKSLRSMTNNIGVGMTWYGDSGGNYILFDNRNSGSESLVRNALGKRNVEIIEQQ